MKLQTTNEGQGVFHQLARSRLWDVIWGLGPNRNGICVIDGVGDGRSEKGQSKKLMDNAASMVELLMWAKAASE